MNFAKEPKNSRSSIFASNEAAIEFCEYFGLLSETKICSFCKSEMRMEYDITYSNKYRLRCTESSCRKSKSLLQGLKICTPKINLCEYLHIIYCWIEKNFEYNIKKNSEVSLNSIKRIKRLIISALTSDNVNTKRKLGQFYPIKVDESIIVKGRLLLSPSETYDRIKGGTWIIGAVEEVTREIVLEIVPNRKKLF